MWGGSNFPLAVHFLHALQCCHCLQTNLKNYVWNANYPSLVNAASSKIAFGTDCEQLAYVFTLKCSYFTTYYVLIQPLLQVPSVAGKNIYKVPL